MEAMETFVVVVSLIAAAIGGLIFLSSLAGKRAFLVKAYNMQKEIEQREAQIKMHAETKKDDQPKQDIPTVTTAS